MIPCTARQCVADGGPTTSGRAEIRVSERGFRLNQNHRCNFARVRRAHRPAGRGRPALSANADDDGGKPEWLRMMEEDAETDEEVANLLRASGGDADEVQRRMRAEMDALHARITGERGAGEDAPVEVSFRQVDPFDLWVWMELYTPPSPAEAEMLQEVINSWFMLGRLGGFNAANLQVTYAAGDAGGLQYETPEPAALVAGMHDVAPLETNGVWARFWVDMGAADELALDVLVNAMLALSREHVGIRRLVVGGQNDDWEVTEREMPSVSMDPSSW